MSINYANAGKLIKEARKNKGLTQKQLAEKTGLATVTIQQYERNLREPRLKNIIKIANALNVSPESLFGSTRIGFTTEFDREKLNYYKSWYIFRRKYTLYVRIIGSIKLCRTRKSPRAN